MVSMTQAAKEFFDTDEGKMTILPATAGVDYLHIDVVDFSDQGVENLFGGKYVAVYIIKDLDPQSDKALQDMYYLKGVSSSLFYPVDIKNKLVEKYGKQKLYTNNITGVTASTFDYELLTDDEKQDFTEYDESTNYFANSIPARDKMWEPLTEQEIDEIKEFTTNIVDESLPKLFQVETSVERPYAVNVFNDSLSSFMSTHATYEDCERVLERLHTVKVSVLRDEMALI